MYKKLIRPLLFLFDAVKVHHFSFALIRLAHKIPFVGIIIRYLYTVKHPKLEREVFGIRFPNPIGLAAGFDKDAKLFRELSKFLSPNTCYVVLECGNHLWCSNALKSPSFYTWRLSFSRAIFVYLCKTLSTSPSNPSTPSFGGPIVFHPNSGHPRCCSRQICLCFYNIR